MILTQIIDIFLHLDKYLGSAINAYGFWIYPLLFIVIFAETGLVIAPFLPGDSLIFAAGALSAQGYMNLLLLFVIFLSAAVIGDTANYAIGSYIGKRAFKEDSRFFRKEYLLRTEEFYERHGGKTIILARFIPIIRTFAPFVAGIGKMEYIRFLAYNLVGAFFWVSLNLFIGYLFGGLPIVQNNFSLLIIAIVLISLSPILIEFLRRRFKKDY